MATKKKTETTPKHSNIEFVRNHLLYLIQNNKLICAECLEDPETKNLRLIIDLEPVEKEND